MYMIKNNVNAVSALKIAIQIEIDAHNLYSNAYSSVKNNNSKEILKLLAEEELAHKKRLEKLYTNISGRKIMALNLKPKLRLREITDVSISPLKVLEIAIENEKENIRFYKESAERTLNFVGKKMFLKLIEEEKNHLDLLEMEYNVRVKSFNEEDDEYNDETTEQVSNVMN